MKHVNIGVMITLLHHIPVTKRHLLLQLYAETEMLFRFYLMNAFVG